VTGLSNVLMFSSDIYEPVMAAHPGQVLEDGLAIAASVRRRPVAPINHVTAVPKEVPTVGMPQTQGLHHGQASIAPPRISRKTKT
jgi:hypothetical protein